MSLARNGSGIENGRQKTGPTNGDDDIENKEPEGGMAPAIASSTWSLRQCMAGWLPRDANKVAIEEDRKAMICGLCTTKSSRLNPYQSLSKQSKSPREIFLGSSVGHSVIVRSDSILHVERFLWTIVDLHLGTKLVVDSGSYCRSYVSGLLCAKLSRIDRSKITGA